VTTRPIKTRTFLENLPLFKEMAAEEVDRIAAGTRELHVSRGQTIFHRGDPCAGFHIVVYGQVKLAFVSSQGAEKVVEIIGPGHSFGEALMFMEKPYVVSAQALADSLLLHVSKQTVFDELTRDPGFARRMLAGLSRRMHGLLTDVEAYSLRSGAQRVIGYLLRNEASTEGADTPQPVTLPVSKAVLASRLNLTPEHFSRILHELADEGLITVSGREITIPDLGKLRAYGG
jgi:CRP/FNR family transcriptional regulator, dissimilatory nitrate respiration regulator